MTEVVLKLDRFAYGGASLGRIPESDSQTGTRGRAVFVPFGLPGERVRVRLVEEKRGFARGELLEVLEPSSQRIEPKCRHFGACGGCHYQHLPYEAQLAAKTEILRDQLVRIGKLENPPVGPMVACPAPWNYRNHVQFHLTGQGRLGYVGSEPGNGEQPPSKEPVFPISECHLPEAPLNALWPELAFEPDSGIERVALRAGSDDVLLALTSPDQSPPEMVLEAGISVVHLSGPDALVLAGDDHLRMRVLERDFEVSAASFFQVNTVMAEKLVRHLLDRLPLPASTILDLYCGVGLFSAFLAPQCEQLIGVESSPAACEDFAINLDEFDHVELYEGAVEQILPSLAQQLSASTGEKTLVVMDPPRAGMDRHALDGLLELTPQVIAYVSCDPATLARDAARLAVAGYRLAEVTPFDLFPQTYHIESISLFKLN